MFVLRTNETVDFVGNWDTVEKLLDADSMPSTYLADHPEIKTFSRLFNKFSLCFKRTVVSLQDIEF